MTTILNKCIHINYYSIVRYLHIFCSVGISLIATTIEGQSTPSVQQLVTTPTSNKENNQISQNLGQKYSMEHFNKNVSQAIEILKASNVVCFDVDSTVIKEEGIDELAKFCGKGAEVQEL